MNFHFMTTKTQRASQIISRLQLTSSAMSLLIIVTITTLALLPGGAEAQSATLRYTIEEESPPMSPIGDLLTDANLEGYARQGDALAFSILQEGNPHAAYLWVNSTGGQLKTYTRINRESVCRLMVNCQLSVRVAVQAQISTFFTILDVIVTITDINDHPPTFRPDTVTLGILEDEDIGSRFRLPTATDADMGPGYSVVGYRQPTLYSPPNVPFTLIVTGSDPSSFNLNLRLDEALDRETSPTYQLLIEAYDGGTPSLTGTLTVNIQVEDVNDNPPMFDNVLYSVNISEITPVGAVITTVRAEDKDADSNGVVEYSMPVVQEDPVLFSLFAINSTTGDIKTLTSLDSYAGRVYRLIIQAQDSGSTPLSATTEVAITVLDTHNSEPEILLNKFGVNGMAQVTEWAEPGKPVAHLAVSDPDSNLSPNGQVTCYLDNDNFELQPMRVNQYTVILLKRLDREEQEYHSVTVTCEDAGVPPRSTNSTFIVEVVDENDSTPTFDPIYYTAELKEGVGNRTVIAQMIAKDADKGINAQLVYRLANGSDPDFGIYTDGTVVVTNPKGVDREDPVKGAYRQLVVLAVDGGTPSRTGTATITVTITDINDNAPKFDKIAYNFKVYELSPVGTIVENVTASDPDADVNAVFYYKMADKDIARVPFEVAPNGVIRVTGEIDRERVASYEFDVVAYDIGEPVSLSSTVGVYVEVKDVNDNSPIFVFPNEDNFTVHVPHTLGVNTAFGNIIARDLDVGKNAELVYSRDSGNGTKYFDVVSETGQIVLIKALTIADLGLYTLVVVVHDKGKDLQMATQEILHVVVYEGNGTLALEGDGSGYRNIIVAIVLVVVTAVLALAILLTIVLIRRVDRQRRLYNAKEEERKADSNLRYLSPGSSCDVDGSTTLSDVTCDSKDAVKKKKEVSFSLDEDNNMNKQPQMSTFNPKLSDKYDPIPDKDRGKLNNDLSFTSNHYQPDRNHTKSSGLQKDVNTFNFHQVPYGSASENIKGRQSGDKSRHHDDNLSDVSGDVSTSDSGRGGSDVELQSHGGASKDSGDTSFMSQRDFNAHNNLSLTNSNGSSIGPGSSYPHYQHPKGSSINHNRNPGKSVHFQNIRTDPMTLGTFQNAGPAMPLSALPPRPPHRLSPKHGGSPSNSRYTPNLFSDEDGSYVKLTNHNQRDNGRRSNPSNQDLERHRNQILMDNFPTNQRVAHNGPSAHPDNEYMDMNGVSSYMSQRSNSNSCLDMTGGWDGDTTTSGSYTVDPQELCEEIDKLFFDEPQDVVV